MGRPHPLPRTALYVLMMGDALRIGLAVLLLVAGITAILVAIIIATGV